jgi:mannan endo-1,4-beta-mannosidase
MTTPSSGSAAPQPPRLGRRLSRRLRAIILGSIAVVAVAAITAVVADVAAPNGSVLPSLSDGSPIGTYSHHPVVIHLPANPGSYLGAFVKGVPGSYEPLEAFADATGVQPNIAVYYSGWFEKFKSTFAIEATANGAVPFIQIDPSGVNLATIVSGVYDTFLKTFATQVASYGARTGHGIIISFGHEMNGSWYSWGYRHTPPKVFVAAWRHIVDIFRQEGADDVTWLWTVNIINPRGGIPAPTAWWPGSSYVTWVGIDGYYLKPSWMFAPLFGPTIKVVQSLSHHPIPILIAETGVVPNANQPAKIANLFAGIHDYGLLGFVWFDAKGVKDWRLDSRSAIAAFRRGARTYIRFAP